MTVLTAFIFVLTFLSHTNILTFYFNLMSVFCEVDPDWLSPSSVSPDGSLDFVVVLRVKETTPE